MDAAVAITQLGEGIAILNKWVALIHALALLPEGDGWVRIGYWGHNDKPLSALRKALGDRFAFSYRAGVIYARKRAL